MEPFGGNLQAPVFSYFRLQSDQVNIFIQGRKAGQLSDMCNHKQHQSRYHPFPTFSHKGKKIGALELLSNINMQSSCQRAYLHLDLQDGSLSSRIEKQKLNII